MFNGVVEGPIVTEADGTTFIPELALEVRQRHGPSRKETVISSESRKPIQPIPMDSDWKTPDDDPSEEWSGVQILHLACFKSVPELAVRHRIEHLATEADQLSEGVSTVEVPLETHGRIGGSRIHVLGQLQEIPFRRSLLVPALCKVHCACPFVYRLDLIVLMVS